MTNLLIRELFTFDVTFHYMVMLISPTCQQVFTNANSVI